MIAPCRLMSVAVIALLLPTALCAVDDVDGLIAKLSDKSESVRLKAAKDLGKWKDNARTAIPALVIAMRDPDEDVRIVAGKSLAAIREAVAQKDGATKLDQISPIIKNLQSKDNATVIQAVEDLKALGTDAKGGAEALIKHGVLNESTTIREAALMALEKISPDLYPSVLTLVVEKNDLIKSRAVDTLKRLGKKALAAVPALNNELEGLVRAATEGRGPRQDFYYLQVLGSIVAISPEDATAKGVILEAMTLGDGNLNFIHHYKLMEQMNISGEQKYKALVEGFSKCKSSVYKSMYIQGIGKLGPDAKDFLPTLSKLKLDSDALVREAAAKAFESIKD